MHSERCTSGSARGHAKLPIARSARRACSTQPYIRMARGFVYLTAVVDVFSRRVLAHRTAITLCLWLLLWGRGGDCRLVRYMSDYGKS